jgi:ketosteroid isomerase-like protein
MPVCRCEDVRLLHDVPADDYSGHLVREAVGPESETISYRCPQTGKRWIAEFLKDDSGALSMELRQVMTAAELVEWLTIRDADEALAWTHPDVEFNLPGETTMHRGLDAAQVAASKAAPGDRPKSRVLSLTPVSPDTAVVLGEMVFRRDGDDVEGRPCAWIVSLRDGRIARSRWFGSWAQARVAAGLPKRTEHRAIKPGKWCPS